MLLANYGDFTLLNSPERLAKEGFLTLASAIYFYMTPRSPKPSIHQTEFVLFLP
ncbi:glycoside hydrolase family 19 protein [Glaciecola sp. 33A]|uniref:glycoside hydrolase family 19 protein n=1 Tax=Glaciecola sp. 33A TaxID=2057807 RepID=UPI0012FEFBB7